MAKNPRRLVRNTELVDSDHFVEDIDRSERAFRDAIVDQDTETDCGIVLLEGPGEHDRLRNIVKTNTRKSINDAFVAFRLTPGARRRSGFRRCRQLDRRKLERASLSGHVATCWPAPRSSTAT